MQSLRRIKNKPEKNMANRRQCRNEDCNGKLIIQGVAGFNDLIEVECNQCKETLELEPDGLGEGGMEMVEAMQIALKNGDIDECDMF
jgi:hypothetical protein